MHTGPIAEHEGKLAEARPCRGECPKCCERKCTMQTWESSCGGYEDEKHTCGACGHVWWVEGPDS